MYQRIPLNLSPNEVIVYLRKSRSDDPLLTVEEVLQNHEIRLDEWAERNLGAKVPEQNKFREVVSGETIADRPEIQKVLRLIESPKYKAVLIVEISRLSRGDLEDAGRLIKLFRYSNSYVITPERTYDIRDEYDREYFEKELKRGNEYLEYFKKIQNNGRLLSVSMGNYLGSVPPYGYTKTTVMDGKRKCPTLKIKEDEAEIVRMIFDMYANQDKGRHVICNYLDSLGVPPPKGKYWSAAAVRDMLQNVHYIGKVKWNQNKTVNVIRNGEVVGTRPRAKYGEYLIYAGKHAAIISDELFEKAQQKIGRGHRTPAQKTIRNPLAGLLYCSCGRAMTLRTYNRAKPQPPRLVCEGHTHCENGSCKYEEMYVKVCELLQDCIDNFEVKIKNNEVNDQTQFETIIKTLESKLEDIEKKELLQWEAQTDPNPEKRMPQEVFQQLNAKLQKEKEETLNALQTAYDSIPEPINYEEKITNFKNALNALQDTDVSAERKNSLLKLCIERIVYSREKPERLKRLPGETKGSRLAVGGGWTQPPISIDVKLKV